MTRSRIAVLVLIAAALGSQPAGVLVAQQPQAPPPFEPTSFSSRWMCASSMGTGIQSRT